MVTEVRIVVTFDYKEVLITKEYQGNFWGDEYIIVYVYKTSITLYTSH